MARKYKYGIEWIIMGRRFDGTQGVIPSGGVKEHANIFAMELAMEDNEWEFVWVQKVYRCCTDEPIDGGES